MATDIVLKRLGKVATKLGSKIVSPDESEQRGLSEKQKAIDEYKKATSEEDPEEYPATSAPVDKVDPKAVYGTRQGEQRIDTRDMLKPLGEAPVYDEGGDVKKPSFMDRLGNAGEAYNKADKAQSDGNQEQAAPQEPARQDVLGWGPAFNVPTYDKGGDVNVNDGRHRVIVAEQGERVLTPEQNEKYEASHPSIRKSPMGSIPVYDDGGKIEDDKDRDIEYQDKDEVDLKPFKGQTGITVDTGGAKAFSNPRGIKVSEDTDRPEYKPDYELQGTKMNTDLAPLGKPKTVMPNPPSFSGQKETPMQEISTKTAMPGAMKPLGGQTKPSAEEQQKYMNWGAEPEVSALSPEEAMQQEQAAKVAKQRELVQKDKETAAQKNDLVGLGTALLHERELNKTEPMQAVMDEAAKGPQLPTATPTLPKYTGMKRIGEGTPGEAQAHLDLEDQRQALRDEILNNPDAEARAQAKEHLLRLNAANPWGSPAEHPGKLGKIGHVLSKIGNIAGDVLAPGTMANIPGTDLNKQEQMRAAQAQEKEAVALKGTRAETALKEKQAQMVGVGATVPEKVYNWAMKGNNGQPTTNPDTNKPFTPPEAQLLSQGTGKTPLELGVQDLMKKNNPKTGQPWDRVDAMEEISRKLAGTKMNEKERRIADYVASHNMEDNPANRETARIATEKADVVAKGESGLPFAEQKARFNDTLATSRALLVQQNADANARGLKADELQNVENARSSAVLTKLQTAKDALNATDEQFSNQIVPVVTLLSVTSAEGVKRVNKQELDKFVPTSGSLGRWAAAHGDQFLSGQIPEEYRDEVGHMLDRMIATENTEHRINSSSIDGTVRQGAQEPVQKPGGGATATPKKSESKAPPATAPTKGGFADWKKQQKR